MQNPNQKLLPDLYKDVDFSKDFNFLDKEMEQLGQQSLKGSKFVDKLVQVFLKDGSDRWILIHIEVQGDADEEFSLRMFRYFYRIFDRHGRGIVSLAILTSPASESAEGKFELKEYGSGVEFQYLTFRLMRYERDELEKDDNPIALVVLAAQERERLRQRSQDRYDVKWYLIRQAYERGYSREKIIGLFEFIDWVIHLNDEEENQLREEIQTLEEVKKMPYITSVQRIGRKEGFQHMVIEALDERFGEIPSAVSDTIHQINDQDRLETLLRQAIRSESLEEFQQAFNGGDTQSSEGEKMPYITRVERIARKEERQQMVIEALEERFEEIPSAVSDTIHQIDDQDQLRTLLRQAIRSASMEEFQQTLNGGNNPEKE